MTWVELVAGLASTIVGGVVVALVTARLGRPTTRIHVERGGSVDVRPDQSRHASVTVTVVQAARGRPAERRGPAARSDDDAVGEIALVVLGVLVGTAAFTFVAPAAGAVLIATSCLLACALAVALVALRRRGVSAPTGRASLTIGAAIVGMAGIGIAVLVGTPGGLTLADRVAELHAAAAASAGGAPSLADVATAMVGSGPRAWIELAAAGLAFLAGLTLAWLAAPLIVALVALGVLASRASPLASRLAMPAVTTPWPVAVAVAAVAALGVVLGGAGLGWAMPGGAG